MFWKRFPNPMTLFVRSLYVLCHKKGVWAKNCSLHPFSMIRTGGTSCGLKSTYLFPRRILSVCKAKRFLSESLLILWAPLLKRQKAVTGLWNKGPLKVLNVTKLILDDHGNNLDSFRISLESFRSFRGPLLHKSGTGQELFLPFLTANRL